MQKIQIIGCGGAGKSTFAVQLGKTLGVAVYHLDKLFWKPGWVPSSREDFTLKLEDIFSKDCWIMDGNYGSTMALRISKSDTIIFLDFSTWTCLTGALGRVLKYRRGTRPDMTQGNDERFDWEFLSWIFSYRRHKRPGILAMLDTCRATKQVVILKDRKEIAHFLRDHTL